VIREVVRVNGADGYMDRYTIPVCYITLGKLFYSVLCSPVPYVLCASRNIITPVNISVGPPLHQLGTYFSQEV